MAKRPRLPWLLVLGAGLARLVPHLANVTPVGGLGLYAGARLPPAAALATPLLAVLLGDLVGGTTAGPVVLAAVYAGLLGGPLAARLLLRHGLTPVRFAGAVGIGALWFFLVSNLGMWLSGIGAWPATAAGLVDCYVAGLPFLARSIAADAACAGALFAGEALLRRRLAPVPAS
jgi:hypothetical protein